VSAARQLRRDLRLTFEEAWPAGRCRWPLFDNKPEPGKPVFCGEHVIGSGAYCPTCSQRAFAKREVKADDAEATAC